jgi:hypothetical protein
LPRRMLRPRAIGPHSWASGYTLELHEVMVGVLEAGDRWAVGGAWGREPPC